MSVTPRWPQGVPDRPKRWLAAQVCAVALLLGGCSNNPPAPTWHSGALAALNSFSAAYLEGNTRVADYEYQRAQGEVARTGRPDLMARLALLRCAVQTASLELGPCPGYEALAADAHIAEQHYARLLAGQWASLQADHLPPAHRDWVREVQSSQGAAATPGTRAVGHASLLAQIPDPLARLVAAAVLLKTELITPTDMGLAAQTASDQGWRRPLLAWLGLQRQRAQAAGDAASAASLQRRIDLVLQHPGR